MDRLKKRNLRSQNQRAWLGEQDLLPMETSLDSSLKKNTAFIKRLRSAVTASTLGTFLHEIRTLSLHKYLSEVISACYEGLCKVKAPVEAEASIEVVSALHQRFGPAEFTEHLAWLLRRGMAAPDRAFIKGLSAEAREKEEKERIIRQRAILRVITELWLVGVLRSTDDISRPGEATKAVTTKFIDSKQKNGPRKANGAEPFPLEILKELLGYDREHVNLPLLVVFVKSFSWEILGARSTTPEERQAVAEDGTAGLANASHEQGLLDQPWVSADVTEQFRSVLKRYFDDVVVHIVKDQEAIQSQARRNAEAYVKSGEVFEDRQASYEKVVRAQERLISNAQTVADVIGAEMPDLKTPENHYTTSSNTIGLVRTGDYLRSMADGPGIWADEDERRFYENLVDLRGKVPSILLDDGKKKKTEAEEQVGKRSDTNETLGSRKDSPASNDLSLSIVNKTIGAQVDALLARLPELLTKESIDQTATDFCFLNSKASRNRLIKALTEIPKGRSDLLPAWSRLIAILGQYMPDIPKGVVDHLDSEFRSLQRRKEKDFLSQVRLSNVRYLAELTKFGVVPEHVVFHCLKVSLDDFSRMNIEVLCNLIENCGRYLLKNPDTASRMGNFLETLQRKKAVQHLGQPERMLIDNAVYHVDPPARPAIIPKEWTPMESFVRKLIYMDLTKRNYNRILKQLRRLHWEEAEVVAILEKVFSKPGKVKFGNIHLLSILLSALHRYHPKFTIKVIDNVIESVSFGLEQNDFRFFQRRIAEVKYLGELYNYRILEHPVIFEVLYKIVTFGYGGPPVPGQQNPFDLSDDFFRIRLVATVLETCEMFFNKGAAGKRLDSFLSFFQYYIFTKTTLPMEIEFVVQDIFALTRPQWRFASSLEEALKAFQQAIAQDKKVAGAGNAAEIDEASSEASSNDEQADADDMEAFGDGEDDSASEDEEAEDSDNDDSSSTHKSSFSEEAIVVTRQVVDEEDERIFEKEYARMMAESLESRNFERKQLFDAPLPVRAKQSDLTSSVPSNGEGFAGKTMAFSLLTKKGNRQQTRTVELPSDSTFAVAMKTQQLAEKEEQQRIKNLVLNYDLQQSEDQDSVAYDRAATHHHNRNDRPQGRDPAQRGRKLQLSDVDW